MKRKRPTDSDIIPAPWAKEAVKTVDEAIRGFNSANPDKSPIRIVWGFRDRETEDRERAQPHEDQLQHGLISWDDDDIEILIQNRDRPAVSLAVGLLTIYFNEQFVLPHDSPTLYNVLMDCKLAGVSP